MTLPCICRCFFQVVVRLGAKEIWLESAPEIMSFENDEGGLYYKLILVLWLRQAVPGGGCGYSHIRVVWVCAA